MLVGMFIDNQIFQKVVLGLALFGLLSICYIIFSIIYKFMHWIDPDYRHAKKNK